MLKNWVVMTGMAGWSSPEYALYYNRFRYYSPQMGMYISSDPIGLAGNNPTLYGYVQDVNIWLDPYALEILYRLLREDENPENGLIAKRPGRGMTVHGHVSSGSRNNGSQFISTSKDPYYLVEKWHREGQRMVSIDTDKLGDSVLIIDISTREKAIAAGVGKGSANLPARSKEVLLVGKVPPEAITLEDTSKYKFKCN